jgi:hypothetical protein
VEANSTLREPPQLEEAWNFLERNCRGPRCLEMATEILDVTGCCTGCRCSSFQMQKPVN